MPETYQRIEFEASDHSSNQSLQLYDFLAADIAATQHGNRFGIRPFDLGPNNGYESPLKIERPYCEPIYTDPEQLMQLADTILAIVMLPADRDALVEAMMQVYKNDEVQKHQQKGGALRFADSHRTYVGEVVQKIASWKAQQELGIANPEARQVSIASRVVSLFKLDLLTSIYEPPAEPGEEVKKWPHHGGMIMEDLLLRFGAVLLTLPNTATGSRMMESVEDALPMRREAIAKTKSAHEQLLNLGGRIFFEAPSATENKPNEEGTDLVLGLVKKRTMELTTDYNQTKGAERIMTIPVFMECNPFGSKPGSIETQPTPFAILEPRVVKNTRDYEYMMGEMASAGTIFKHTGGLPYIYDKRRRYLGRRLVPDVFYGHKA